MPGYGRYTNPPAQVKKPHWKTVDVGYFWPDIPANMGTGRIVDYKNERYFRDVKAFVSPPVGRATGDRPCRMYPAIQ